MNDWISDAWCLAINRKLYFEVETLYYLPKTLVSIIASLIPFIILLYQWALYEFLFFIIIDGFLLFIFHPYLIPYSHSIFFLFLLYSFDFIIIIILPQVLQQCSKNSIISLKHSYMMFSFHLLSSLEYRTIQNIHDFGLQMFRIWLFSLFFISLKLLIQYAPRNRVCSRKSEEL